MIVYKQSAAGFRSDVDNNQVVKEVESVYMTKLGRRASPSERQSWNNSFQFMETVLRKSAVPDDCGVLIEYTIPATNKRIDFIISGYNDTDQSNFVIVELKQWDKANATPKDGIVTAYVGGGVREVAHPSYQAFSYKQFLADMNEAIYTQNLNPFSCAYLHNYHKSPIEPLLDDLYKETIKDTPLFFAGDVEKLGDFITRHVGKGKGLDILYEIEHGRIKPSRKFIDYVLDIFDGNKVFTLIDEQKVAYENILFHARADTKKKVLIINGEPGTGKSVVAMNALAGILKEEKNVKFVAPNASFRSAMIEMLSNNRGHTKKRLSALFSGSASYFDSPEDEFAVLIVDEAHRLKQKGAYQYRGENQVQDIINAARVSVFFIDDNQRIRPEDVGSVEMIKHSAETMGAEVINIELATQFRCSGAEGYVNWVHHNLQLGDTGNYDGWDEGTYEFKICDTPNELFNLIKEKQDEGLKARLLAGFAWPWTAAKDGNPNAEVEDVVIEEHNFRMPWNSRTDQYSWAMDNEKVNQVGCIHTSQGLEFDYVGIIIGNDLRYCPEEMKVYASYDDYYDRVGKRGLKDKPEDLSRLVKNIYKVLMTRGVKGCYVFCRDPHLQYYLRSRLVVRGQAMVQ